MDQGRVFEILSYGRQQSCSWVQQWVGQQLMDLNCSDIKRNILLNMKMEWNEKRETTCTVKERQWHNTCFVCI